MPSSASEAPVTPDLFRPTVVRCLSAIVIAAAAFCLPQAIPLEYFPLNNPSAGLQYLEITCAANYTDTVQVFLDVGHGFNELDKIEWPISPTEGTFTYTFPLPDAPLFNLRIDPLRKGTGEFEITNLRIINRRDEAIRTFGARHLINADHVAVTTEKNGFKLVMKEAQDPKVNIQLDGPILAEGMNARNFKRCLLSAGYLALMLWIILLAVFFAFRQPEPWKATAASMGFLALIAVFFSLVGNRGLIRNSIQYAQTSPPWVLDIEVAVNHADTSQLYWDTGKGFNEKESRRIEFDANTKSQTLHFPLPDRKLVALRFDPLLATGRIEVHSIHLIDTGRGVRIALPMNTLEPVQSIAQITCEGDKLLVETTSNANDPILAFSNSSVAKINDSRIGVKHSFLGISVR